MRVILSSYLMRIMLFPQGWGPERVRRRARGFPSVRRTAPASAGIPGRRIAPRVWKRCRARRKAPTGAGTRESAAGEPTSAGRVRAPGGRRFRGHGTEAAGHSGEGSEIMDQGPAILHRKGRRETHHGRARTAFADASVDFQRLASMSPFGIGVEKIPGGGRERGRRGPFAVALGP